MIVSRRTGWTPDQIRTLTGYEYDMLRALLIDEQEKK